MKTPGQAAYEAMSARLAKSIGLSFDILQEDDARHRWEELPGSVRDDWEAAALAAILAAREASHYVQGSRKFFLLARLPDGDEEWRMDPAPPGERIMVGSTVRVNGRDRLVLAAQREALPGRREGEEEKRMTIRLVLQRSV